MREWDHCVFIHIMRVYVLYMSVYVLHAYICNKHAKKAYYECIGTHVRLNVCFKDAQSKGNGRRICLWTVHGKCTEKKEGHPLTPPYFMRAPKLEKNSTMLNSKKQELPFAIARLC